MTPTKPKASKPKLVVIFSPLKKAHAMTRKARPKAASPKTVFFLNKAHTTPNQNNPSPFERLALELAATRKIKRPPFQNA